MNTTSPDFSEIQRALDHLNAQRSILDTERLPEPVPATLR